MMLMQQYLCLLAVFDQMLRTALSSTFNTACLQPAAVQGSDGGLSTALKFDAETLHSTVVKARHRNKACFRYHKWVCLFSKGST